MLFKNYTNSYLQKNLKNLLQTPTLNKNYIKKFSFNTFNMNTQTESSETEREKATMKRLYSKKVDDSYFSDILNSLIKKTPAFIAYKGQIRMDYFAKSLQDFNIPFTVVNLDYNPVFNEAFSHFYPSVNKSKYVLFLKGKMVDTEEFLSHINKRTVEEYLKNYNMI
jgi:hypothetical protein